MLYVVSGVPTIYACMLKHTHHFDQKNFSLKYNKFSLIYHFIFVRRFSKSLSMLHIHREKDENVQSVVDKFANAKERHLLFK